MSRVLRQEWYEKAIKYMKDNKVEILDEKFYNENGIPTKIRGRFISWLVRSKIYKDWKGTWNYGGKPTEFIHCMIFSNGELIYSAENNDGDIDELFNWIEFSEL